MVKENKNSVGRPKGTGTGQQITARLRKEIYSALHITDKRGKPVDFLIADQLEKDASGTISKLSKLLPQDISVTGAGSEFALALQDVATRIGEANRILDAKDIPLPNEGKGDDVQDADIIEHSNFTSEPEEENVTKPKRKAGRPSKLLSKLR